MATFNKFNSTVGYIGNASINFASDTFKLILTNTAPSTSDTVYNSAAAQIQPNTNAAELSTSGGYTQGGSTIGSTSYTDSGGLGSFNGNSVVWTASGGGFGPFRYVTIYDATAGNANARPVLGWWDFGSSLTLASPNTFTANTNAGIATLQ
jgi:hypothetical protein